MQAGTYFPKVRRMLLFHAALILTQFWPAFHAASRAPCSCHSVSSWDRSSIFGALGYGHEVHLHKYIPNEGFWSRILVWRAIAFVIFTRWIGLCMSVALPENRLRRRHVLKYATQLPCIRWSTFRRLLSNFLSLILSGFPDRSWHWSVTGPLSCNHLSSM